MIYTPSYSLQFKKDLKLCSKRGYNMGLIKEIMNTLASSDTLPPKNKDHSLSGNYAAYRECHIQPDWLLIYRINENDLFFTRTGTHANLFQ